MPHSHPFPSPSPSLSPSSSTTSQKSTVFAVAPPTFCSRSFSVLSYVPGPHDFTAGAPTLPYVVVQDARPPMRLRSCRDKDISLSGYGGQFIFGGVLHFSSSLSLHYKSVNPTLVNPRVLTIATVAFRHIYPDPFTFVVAYSVLKSCRIL